ncbi:MAG: type I DNA topoisomerase [Gemmatimonadota bacterium]|nr:type I DNA topoisomerase [Gemmatimonadota bacterium]
MAKKKSTSNGRANLVIVESPAKARAIGKYLGDDFAVVASVGHVRDLPPKELGVDPEKGFEPTYTIIRGKKKVLDEIRKAAKGAERVYVATDPDREGEAIAWHIVDETKIPADAVHRATFYEITPAAVRKAIESPGRIDLRKVDSQQARRILDRLVGYRISPLLTDPFYPGLSAGRVQTVALRIVVEREEEIDAFQRVPYWKVKATLDAGDGEEGRFDVDLQRAGGVAVVPRGQPGEKRFRAPALGSEEEAANVVERVKAADWSVTSVEKKERRRTAAPPFTTSTLQQEASRRLRYSAKRTMALAQRLYEGVEIRGEPVGLITYMRTDSTRVSGQALDEVRSLIGERYGEKYRPKKPNFYRSKGDAQEAHEAIRPTSAARPLDEVKKALYRRDDGRDLFRLYELIWLKFVSSQMTPAVYDRTTVEFVIDDDLEFRASGSVLRFPGFLKAYIDAGKGAAASDDVLLPALEEDQAVDLVEIESEGKETQPPSRYSEATLVKELEAQGIGRPSTYAAIISRLFDRNYAERDGRRIKPTVLGRYVLRYLLHHFDDIFEVGFTREMEEELDKVEEGELEWRSVVQDLWKPLREDIERVGVATEDGDGASAAEGDWIDLEAPTCPKDADHGSMLLRWNRYGPFWGCREYPECKQTLPIPELGPDPPDEPCPKCGSELAIKRGRRGPFVGCDAYPDCDFTMNIGENPQAVWAQKQRAKEQEEALDRECPKCGEGRLRVRSGRFGPFIGCDRYPKCRYTEPLPTGVDCPECGEGELLERRGKGKGKRRKFFGCSRYPECEYTQQGMPRVAPCPECGHEVAEVARSDEGERLRCPRCKADVPEPAEAGAS